MALPLFDRFLAPADAAAPFDDTALIQAMFDFEAALSRAQAAVGMIPASSAAAIASVCKAELYDLNALAAASTRAGSLAIPLVKELTQTVSLYSAEAASIASTARRVHSAIAVSCTSWLVLPLCTTAEASALYSDTVWVSSFTSGMARLPARVLAVASALRSYSSALHTLAMAPANAAGNMPAAAWPRASAASKSNIAWMSAMSSNGAAASAGARKRSKSGRLIS